MECQFECAVNVYLLLLLLLLLMVLRSQLDAAELQGPSVQRPAPRLLRIEHVFIALAFLPPKIICHRGPRHHSTHRLNSHLLVQRRQFSHIFVIAARLYRGGISVSTERYYRCHETYLLLCNALYTQPVFDSRSVPLRNRETVRFGDVFLIAHTIAGGQADKEYYAIKNPKRHIDSEN